MKPPEPLGTEDYLDKLGKMPGKDSFPLSLWTMPLRLTLFYVLIAAGWILGSDALTNLLIARYGTELSWLHTIKGVGFVLLTGLAFYGLTRSLVQKAWKAHLKYHQALTRKQARLIELTHFDTLTRLANRRYFHQALTRAFTARKQGYLLLIGLDRFKQINNNLGHEAGDELLCLVADRLRQQCHADSHLARTGDVFSLLLPGGDASVDVTAWSRRLKQLLAQPFNLTQHTLFITASMGIVRWPEDGRTADELMRHAEHALAEAKQKGRNSICAYTPPAKAVLPISTVSLENALHRAWQQQDFSLHYQPKLCLQSRRILGFEALMRWHPQDLGPVSPELFIPVLEDTGLIIPIGYWLIEQACRDLQQLARHGFNQSIAVNITARQLTQDEFAEQLLTRLHLAEVAPQRLSLELTESSLMQEQERAERLLTQLREAQVSIALDDFGTGYSSLSYLKRLPVDTLKIDRSFIDDIVQEQDDRGIVDAIIRMAHGLSMTVVAEGVETESQIALLQELGCDQAQGYWCASPMPIEELIDWLSEAKRAERSQGLIS
ncbi:putative bifunctional diguanylate cyclase/phosphodiesterase [Zobellella maritima]|uniref:putative bifunctional diguanylate cyclase/phosphodiesterase n=1 Tax=Zobellella maritima TaxID=2059725 RepID=UPI000E30B1C6|nr:bifunctional diguanylate cyclase/phosphodiesterase [Zobellella maritima]